ncbi:MAG: hypothetical protein LBC94_03555 [Desulfovibrio sp.]|jgi:hypothetical protein|nr:hypothetical protein [Desulfovibrio sp.]
MVQAIGQIRAGVIMVAVAALCLRRAGASRRGQFRGKGAEKFRAGDGDAVGLKFGDVVFGVSLVEVSDFNGAFVVKTKDKILALLFQSRVPC